MTAPVADPVFRWTSELWGSALRCVPLESAAQHLFTTRQLPLRATEDMQTRDAWGATLASVGVAPDHLMRVRQVHGSVVRLLAQGRIPDTAARDRPDADAIVSNQPGLALAVLVADCVPILIATRDGGAAAAIHAGWRGTCARVVGAAVQTMVEACGADPSTMTAALGPSIGPADYEVGESLMAAFRDAGHPRASLDRWFGHAGGRRRLDLWSANREQLIGAGLQPDRIFGCGLSTLAHPREFHSFRRDGAAAGRMAAIIVVPDRGPAAG